MAKKKAANSSRSLGTTTFSILCVLVGIALAIYGIFWPTTIIVGWSSLILGIILIAIAYKLWKCKRTSKNPSNRRKNNRN